MKKTLTKENLPIKYEKRKKYSIRGFENVAPYTLSSWGILEQLHVGYMLENFDDNACRYANYLRSVYFSSRPLFSPRPKVDQRIGKYAFAECPFLSRVEFSKHLTEIDDHAFEESGIEHANLPSSLKRLGDSAFAKCRSLKSAVIPEGITDLNNNVFESCVSMRDISTPKSLKVIHNKALSKTGLTKFVHNGDLDRIDKFAFKDCEDLETFKVTGTVENLDDAFEGCSHVTQMSFGDIINVGDNAFSSLLRLKKITGLKSTRSIGNSAFFNSKIEEINIPETLEHLGSSAFERSEIYHCDLSKATKLKELKDSTFRNCTNLTTLSMSDSVESIGEELCAHSRDLRSVRLSTKLTELPKDTFAECKSLQEINELPNLVKIGEGAFERTALEKFTAGDKLQLVDDFAFIQSRKLQEFSCQSENLVLGSCAFDSCTSLKKVSAKSIKSIKSEAFSNCTSLEVVEGLENVEKIDSNAFGLCNSLKKVKISNPNALIHINAFSGCKFDYMYKTKDGSLIFSKTPPEPEEEVTQIHNLSKYYECLPKFSPSQLLKRSNDNTTSQYSSTQIEIDPALEQFVDFMNKNGFAMNSTEFENWYSTQKYKEFINSADLDTFYELNSDDSANKKENDFIDQLKNSTFENKELAFKMAYSLGCFSNEIVNNNGQQLKLSRIASQTIKKLNLSHTVSLLDFMQYFSKYRLLTNDSELPQPNKKLNEFLLEDEKSEKVVYEDANGKKKSYYKRYYPNVEFICNHENISEAKKLIKDYDNLCEYLSEVQKNANDQRNAAIDRYMIEHSVPREVAESQIPEIKRSQLMLDAIELSKQIKQNPYAGTKYEKHGFLYQKLNLTDDQQNKAISWYNQAEKDNIPHHILGKPLTKVDRIKNLKTQLSELEESDQQTRQELEDKISELKDKVASHEMTEEEMHREIQSLIESTGEKLADTLVLLDRLQTNKFSFEMLDKYDERNAVAGQTIASCCATVTKSLYGKQIAHKTITDKNYQNLHIIDKTGNSAGKVTLYVDEQRGTIVLNSIELKIQYRRDEDPDRSGHYTSSQTSQRNLDRELIFDTILDGLYSFIDEYNLQHPEQPIKQVNLGHTYNRLKKQSERYDHVTQKDRDYISPPDEFEDAYTDQYVLYRQGDKLSRNPELDEILRKRAESENNDSSSERL